MHLYMFISKNGKIVKDELMEKISNNHFIFKWNSVSEEGAYSFYIEERGGTIKKKSITFDHTAPFSKIFEAYVSEKEEARPIAGIREGEDLVIEYFIKENRAVLRKVRFTKFRVDLEKFGIQHAKRVDMPGSFNGWNITAEELKHISGTHFETLLPLEDGVYEYKLVVDGRWIPDGENKRLIVGEVSTLFPVGRVGSGAFVYDAIEKNDKRKAIKHDQDSLQYINRVSHSEVEMTIRVQKNDIETAYVHIIENEVEEIYELERVYDKTSGFEYFKRVIKLRINPENFNYYFELKDGVVSAFYGKDGFSYDVGVALTADYSSGSIPQFFVSEWAKDAIWYNIFPDRFYNGNRENDPIYNEFGPECFAKPDSRAELIDEYKWGIYTDKYGKFENNRWNSDFEKSEKWEELKGLDVNYSLKYARMYGGDLQGIKEKIPYLKELGITAIWLNPVFFSDSNHKYGAGDFRHISPDFGTIKMSGDLHGVDISKDNPYGNRSYVDIFGDECKNRSELKELRIKLTGENRLKNGYLESEDPSTWVWSESDLIAVDLIKELHKNGIRVIFDGVFNHSGPTHWSFEAAMADGEQSKYSKWYKIHDTSRAKKITEEMSEEEAYGVLLHNKSHINYTGWAGFAGLPEFNTYNKEVMEYLFNITRKWMLGPDGKSSKNWMEDDGIDGWRLDVPNCVENQEFWHEWRKVVKECKLEGYITAELWGDARGEINPGKKYDTVMNYEWLKSTIGFFINKGTEHNRNYKLSAEEFFEELREKRYWYPRQAVMVSQNLNGSHDTDRLISRVVNDRLGRDLEEGKQHNKGYNTICPDFADNHHHNTTINWKESDIKPKDILKLISIFQMTYIGAPMIYYGDEAGMWGATDPYCRKPMLWDEIDYEDETDGTINSNNNKYRVKRDNELFEWYKKIIKIRKENRVLSRGHFREVMADNEKDIIAYERFDESEYILVIINNSENKSDKIKIFINEKNIKLCDLISGKEYMVENDGEFKINIEKKSGVILKRVS
jgi:cyclomaltodextrinase / maltogenic alpha-amylase / neopullulanase